MTVQEMIIELLNYDMDETLNVSLDNKEKVTDEITIENWYGTPIIHFNDWRESSKAITEHKEFHCPCGDNFEGGDECDRREQHELCMEASTDVIERSKYDNLHNLAKSWLEEKKTLSEKLEKIRQIVNDKHYSVKSLTYEIKEILDEE